MACSRGAAGPDSHTQKRLFAASGGYCQNPHCFNPLFSDERGQSIHIAEMAHVYAASDNGPRGNPSLTEEARGSFDNLIVLCANCHTRVDKAPEAYSDTMMHEWKSTHALKLERAFGVMRLESRAEVRELIDPLLSENRVIFNRYGPHVDRGWNPENGMAEQWKRKVLSRIIPNNQKILAILDANHHLARPLERASLELFRQHVDDMQAFHIEGIKQDGSRFPEGFGTIMED